MLAPLAGRYFCSDGKVFSECCQYVKAVCVLAFVF